MLAMLGAALLQSLLLASTFDLKLQADAQVRGGYNQTPFITGIDSAPLLNATGNGTGSAQFNTVLTPAATFGIKTPRFNLTLGYQPRIFVDMASIATVAPTVFHRAALQLAWGRPQDWQVTGGADISVGGLDFGQAGQLAGEFSGSLRPGANSGALGYVSSSAFVKADDYIGTAWHLQSAQSVGRMSTPPVVSANYTQTSSGDLFTLQNGSTAPPLQSQARVDSKWLVGYRVNSSHELSVDVLGNITSFQSTATFLSLTPSVGWLSDVSMYDKLSITLGVMKYWTNPFPGRYLNPVYNVVGQLDYQHRFTDFGLPNLTGSMSIGETPYYDIIYGQIQPRGTASLALGYDFSREWKARLQVRDYTQLYWDGRRVRPLGKGRDKNVIVGNVEVNYVLSQNLDFKVGIFGLNRWIVPSGTLPYSQLREYYGFVSVTGTYDVD